MVAPLPDWLTDQTRQTQRVRFDRTCEVLRKTKVNNGMGGSTATETVVATYACSVGPITARKAEQLAAREIVVTTADQVATLDFPASVLMTDRLRIGGQDFEVVDVEPPYSRQTAVQVVIRGGA